MNALAIKISVAVLLAGLTKMSEWVDTYLPWLPWFFVGTGILGILIGCFWNKSLSLKSAIKMRTKSTINRLPKIGTVSGLSVTVEELVIDGKRQEVMVWFQITNKSPNKIQPTYFMGSVELDATTISKDLKLTNFISNYRFNQYDTRVLIRFSIKPEILAKLKSKKQERQEAYWMFDLDWNLRFPSRRKLRWKPTDIHFQQIPRIGNVHEE